MDFKPLDKITYRPEVACFFERTADYVMLEHGRVPDADTVDDFFDDRPPHVAAEDSLHFGLLEDQNLIGIAGILFGFPEKTDAYIGLMLLAPEARGRGNGAQLLSHLTGVAQARGAQRQLVAVLDANPKGRAFWDREGFMLETSFPPIEDRHTRHRLIRTI
ncbi:GNAT family N-acetyltransferase [Octadecabacter sp.]|nr:GNAT family N-acetyltransferase [Octadecabacter sp.]MDC1229775.1 GNAT family N-acetyltransferase [Octadecabacter sp.]